MSTINFGEQLITEKSLRTKAMINTKKEDKRLVQKKYELQRNSRNHAEEKEKKPLVFNKRQDPLSFVVDWQLVD